MAEPAMIFLFSTCEGRDDTGVVDNIDPPSWVGPSLAKVKP